jgi:energy-coupling factor transport system substrate-specific component
MSTPSVERLKPSLKDWTTRDILVTAAIAAALAIVSTGANYLMAPLHALGPAAAWAITGIWVIPGVFTAYVVRRPGAAFLSQLLTGIMQAPFSPFGWTTVIRALVTGVPSEGIFLATRYRNYRLPLLLVVAGVANVVHLAVGYVPHGYFNLPPGVQIAMWVITWISGVVAGGLAKGLGDVLAQTGVLASFAIGQEGEEI